MAFRWNWCTFTAIWLDYLNLLNDYNLHRLLRGMDSPKKGFPLNWFHKTECTTKPPRPLIYTTPLHYLLGVSIGIGYPPLELPVPVPELMWLVPVPKIWNRLRLTPVPIFLEPLMGTHRNWFLDRVPGIARFLEPKPSVTRCFLIKNIYVFNKIKIYLLN